VILIEAGDRSPRPTVTVSNAVSQIWRQFGKRAMKCG
jgi:hypothetical protein